MLAEGCQAQPEWPCSGKLDVLVYAELRAEAPMELPGSGYGQQAVDVLRDLLRMDTTNPPGNEIVCAQYLANLLAPAGIETAVFEPSPRRGSVVARLRTGSRRKPLLLMGHTDVVAVDQDTWQHPPFGGEIHDGFIWGRGATDMKQMVAVSAVIMLALASQKQHLKCDVILAATADEEHGGRMGMGWLAKHHPELIDAACAINEGGGSSFELNDRLYFTCQTAEKGVCRTVWTTAGRGGHGAYPHDGIAPLRLADAIGRLGDGHIAPHAIETMVTAVRTIAADRSEHAAQRVVRLLRDGRIEDALRTAGFSSDDVARNRALFYDTASVTGLRAGDPTSINVIPPTAQAYVDGRILPGQTRDGFVRLLESRVSDGVDIQVYQEQYSPGLESPHNAAIVDTMNQVISERIPGARVVPWQCAGSTDAKHLIDLGVPVYGFVPSKPLPDGLEGAGAHASNERIWLEDLQFALEVLYDIVWRYCAESDGA